MSEGTKGEGHGGCWHERVGDRPPAYGRSDAPMPWWHVATGHTTGGATIRARSLAQCAEALAGTSDPRLVESRDTPASA